MRKIDELLEEYRENHQHSVNKVINLVCVPLIFFSVIGLTASIPSSFVQRFLGEGNPYANWAAVIIVFVLVYYVTLSIPLGFGMMLFCVLCLYLVRLIKLYDMVPLWSVSLIIFAVACAGQFYGQTIEGKKTSFIKDMQFFIIGPAWLMHFVYRKLGIPY